MAIKVSGTTVIDGSRNLTNITGLDATTISTIESNISAGGPVLGTVTGNATIDLSTGTVFEYTPTLAPIFEFTNPPSSGTAASFQVNMTGAIVTAPYDVSSISYTGNFLSVASQDSSPQGLAFKPDGTKMFILGTGTGTGVVYEFDLSTAWDITTASFIQSFTTPYAANNNIDITMKPDGTRMYITDDSSRGVRQYNLSTAWDVSTAAYNSFASTSALGADLGAIVFSPDGTRMYVTEPLDRELGQFSLSTPWEVSTATYVNRLYDGNLSSSSRGMAISNDGSRIVVVSGSQLHYFILSVPWDVTTGTLTTSGSISAQESSQLGIAFRPNGEGFYTIGAANDRVYEYDITATEVAQPTFFASVEWSGGSAPAGPAAGDLLSMHFVTVDGGVSYQASFGVAPSQALGEGQSWQPVTRNSYTWYQNTTGRTIAVAVRTNQIFNADVGFLYKTVMYINSSASYTNAVTFDPNFFFYDSNTFNNLSGQGWSFSANPTLFGIIPPGHYYVIISDNPSMPTWELK